MSEEAANRAQWWTRRRFQQGLDAALAGDAEAAAEVHAAWEPVLLAVTEGMDIGEPAVPEADLESERRWNERPQQWQ